MTEASRKWRSAGKPWRLAQPIADLSTVLRRRGYVIGTIGNDAHLDARTPEDHTPFSVTGWPKASEYPYVHAMDIMPPRPGSGLPSLVALGAQLVADRRAGFGPAMWVKYINWTRGDGSCVHESWKPNHRIVSSSDRGHIHISARSDYTHSMAGAGYDPVARLGFSAPPVTAVAPPFGGRMLRYVPHKSMMSGTDVRIWQQRMRDRGWRIAVDGIYGPRSAEVARAFQREKRLQVDGIVGPATWAAAWLSPVT